jgi:5'-nucleotidase (lipoprotein e(P4) family)
MSNLQYPFKFLATLLLGIFLGIAVNSWSVSATATLPSQGPEPLIPAYRGLDASVYVQTAAEYRACCLQTYNAATQSLKAKVEKAGNTPLPLAFVADLDETVLDNAGFQTLQIMRNISFEKSIWDQWQSKYQDQVAFIPGAKDFILTAKKLGVFPVFISNRDETYRAQTKEILTRLGIPIEKENQLKLAMTTSDKTRRRLEAEGEYQVLLYLGDNLRDFDEVFKTCPLPDKNLTTLQKASLARKQAVDARQVLFGDKWFILPNPVYGEWTVATTRSKEDENLLVPPPIGLK